MMSDYGTFFRRMREAKGFSLRETADGIVSYQF